MGKFRFMDEVFDTLEEVQTFAARLDRTGGSADQEDSEAVREVPVNSIGSGRSPDVDTSNVRCEIADESPKK